tara:strand:+ start:609 stop:1907 length:1299 start_codon:yes stop_codon:yes gene_type:complete
MLLKDKLKDKSATICVIGLGYVGLPLICSFAKSGFNVVGLDIDESKISSLKSKKSYISYINDSVIEELTESSFTASSDYSHISDCDVIIFCVPTPLSKNREPDLSFVLDTMMSIKPFLRESQMISIESTTYPGMTDEIIAKEIDSKNFTIGKDYFLIYSPEREDPGNKDFSTSNIPKIVGGHTEHCLNLGKILYESIVDQVVSVSSTKAAEMTKLLENIQRSVNIGLMNEMKVICTAMGLDIHEVIKAAETKPFGFVSYYPGPGIGGHCIPIDPFYLTWKAKEFGLNTRFIELAGEINHSMPEWVLNQLTDELNNRSLPIKNSKVLILGIAYKKNVDDMRESPASLIMKRLEEKGAHFDYSDPFIPSFPKIRNFDFGLKSIELSPQIISSYDAVILVTDHDEFDYEMIIDNASLLIDTRGVYFDQAHNLIKA